MSVTESQTVSVKRLDARVDINLHADAPPGCPHYVDQKNIRNKNDIPDDLSVVDILVTELMHCWPQALSHLFDLNTEEFNYESLYTGKNCSKDKCRVPSCCERSKLSIWRLRNYVHLLLEFEETSMNKEPFIELFYRIEGDGKWEILGFRRGRDRLAGYHSDDENKNEQKAAAKELAWHLIEMFRYKISQDEKSICGTRSGGAHSSPGVQAKGSLPQASVVRDNSATTKENTKVTELQERISKLEGTIKELTGSSRLGDRKRTIDEDSDTPPDTKKQKRASRA